MSDILARAGITDQQQLQQKVYTSNETRHATHSGLALTISICQHCVYIG